MAYVILDKPPGDPSARQLPGTFEVAPRESNNPAEFGAIFQTVAPGFAEVSSGLNGVGLLKEYGGQKVVVRTHPVDQKRPMVAKGVFDLPADKPSRLLVHVANDSRGDFRLVVKVNGKVIYEEIIGKSTTESGWARREIDLAPFAGTQPVIEVLNEANNWAYEFAYWGTPGNQRGEIVGVTWRDLVASRSAHGDHVKCRVTFHPRPSPVPREGRW